MTKLTLSNLVDSKTKEPIEIEIPDEWASTFGRLGRRAEEAGRQVREALATVSEKIPETEETFRVYAIKSEGHERGVGWLEPKTIAVAAESEYGAIKRFCSFHVYRIIDIAEIPDRKPEYNQRRIEGTTEFDWATLRGVDGEENIMHDWEYR